MDASVATRTLDFLANTVQTAMAGVEAWAWFLFAAVIFWSFLVDWSKSSIAGNPLDWKLFGQYAIGGISRAAFVGAYFASVMPLMHLFRQAGMSMSGSTMETVDIGELFRQRDEVSQRIYETINLIEQQGVWEQIKDIPEVLFLNFIGGIVFLQYLSIALIAVWVFARFLLAYLNGGVLVGALGSGYTQEYGRRAIAFAINSMFPLMLLAFMQGISARLIEEADVFTGETEITVSALWDLAQQLGFVFFLCLIAALVPKDILQGLVGTGGAPSASKAIRAAGGAGAAITNTVSQISSVYSALSKTFSGGGGGGGSPSIPPPTGSASGGGSSVPKLTFNSKKS